MKALHLSLNGLQSTDAAPDDDAEALEIRLCQIDPGILQRELRASHGKLSETVGAAGVLGGLEPGRGVEALDLASDEAVVASGVKSLILGNSRTSLGEVLPEGGDIRSDGTDDSETGDDNSAFAHRKIMPGIGVGKVNRREDALATMEKG